jgi:hypothetical protein
VNPPGIQDWETTAAAWLLDLVPEYRQHAAVRRHPVILAFIARYVIAGAVEGARQGYRVTRGELGDLVPPHAIDAALRAWRVEGERLAATACAVDLVERALRGETFRPRLLRSGLESGDRPELVGDKQRDQIPELLSAQFDLAAVVIYERDSPVLGPSRLITISGTEWCVTSSPAIGVAFRVLTPASLYQGERVDVGTGSAI